MTGEDSRDIEGAWNRWKMVSKTEESNGMGIVGGSTKDILRGLESRSRYLL